jgi:hypothetical protein
LLKAFRNEFLGTSTAASSCIIENEEQIELWYNNTTHSLIARCNEPVRRHNRHLGYKIYVTLEQFEAEYESRKLGVGTPLVLLKSSTFFNDIAPTNLRIAERRDAIFKNSRTFFLRALANNQLEYAGFDLTVVDHHSRDSRHRLTTGSRFNYQGFGGENEVTRIANAFTVELSADWTRVTLNEKVMNANGETFYGLPYVGKLYISSGNNEVSEIIFFTDTFQIDAWGQLTKGDDVLFRNYMGSLRFGDELPFDYGIK